MTKSELRIDANPEKRFFISMLTKDIELIPAVIDLVDNSVDGARGQRGAGDLQKLHIDLTVSPDQFEITDNCGGIDSDIARKYTFRFGRPAAFGGVESSVGQFGVGMKAALFKLGSAFTIESVTATSAFAVHIDVDQWAKNPSTDWTFEFASLVEGKKQLASKIGTRIVVKPLLPSVADDFARQEIASRISQTIAIQHQNALGRGLTIRVNGTAVKPVIPRLLLSKHISPIREEIVIKVEGGAVTANLIAGIAAPIRRDTRDDGAAESFTDPGDAGWYVFCNERLVMAADKTEVTGWGISAAAYHPQYRWFRGYLFLSAKDSALLPWNTTKTALDQDSHVFRVVQQRMFQALTAVQSILNRQKAEIQQRDEGDRPLTQAIAAATETRLESIPLSLFFKAPPLPAKKLPVPPSLVQVNFKVDRELFDQALDTSGFASAAKLGRTAFDYYVQYELGIDP